jgi:hypothetical protein
MPNRLHDESFRTVLRMRLGIPFSDQHVDCTGSSCRGVDDAFGFHAFRCADLKGAGNTRHKFTNDTIHAVMTQAGLTAMKEVPYVGTYPHNPDGPQQDVKHRIDTHVLLPSGVQIVIDTTVRHPLHPEADERDKLLEVSAFKRRTWMRKHPNGAPELTGHVCTV